MEPDTKTQSEASNPFEYEFKQDYISDWDVHRRYIITFDAYEAMLQGQVYDAVSAQIDGSKMTDSYSTTLAIERAARVMGKLPDGETEATAKADQGKAAFMDILRQKWMYPNANSQHKFPTKLRLWQLYSSVYGYMPMFYDWNVSPSGYVGPDCWLWSPRNLIPQQGRVSIADMDYVTALTWVGKQYIQDIIDKSTSAKPKGKSTNENVASDNKLNDGGWNVDALKELLELANRPTNPDIEKNSMVERSRTPQAIKRGICLATRYEAGEEGEWVTFAPDHSYVEVRRLKNPHKNGRIPFVIKYSQPLFDSFYGLGDFQRSKGLQFGRDGLRNFYFKGVKMNLIPPVVANANGVLKHTIDYREGAVMLETIPNSIRRLETSTAGLSTYQAAMSDLTGSLLTMYGTQNASLPGSEALNPSQGKTPAAISMYSGKEADRDGQELSNLEEAIEALTDGFFSMVTNIGTEDIPVQLYSKDIEAIVAAGLTDVLGLFTGNFKPNSTLTGGELKIDPTKLNGVEYRFNINPGSTAKMNKDAMRQQLDTMIGSLAKFQNIWKDDPRYTVNWDKIMAQYEAMSDIPNASQFVTFNPQAQPPQPPPPAPKPPVEMVNFNYADARTPQVAQQIEQMFGLQPDPSPVPSVNAAKAMGSQQPTPPAAPTIATTGHAFQNPHLAEVANALHKRSMEAPPPPPPPAEPATPNVIPGGMSFNDPHLAQVATELTKKATEAPPPAPVGAENG